MRNRLLVSLLLLPWCIKLNAAPRVLIPEKSQIDFVVKEMGVPVTGQFNKFDAAIEIDLAQLPKSSAKLRIDVGSLDTGNPEADKIATDGDWLDSAHAQYAVFTSASISALGSNRYQAQGTLRIRNIDRPITIEFTSVDQPGGQTMIESQFEINRTEFGIGAGVWNEKGVVAEQIPVKVKLLLAPLGQSR